MGLFLNLKGMRSIKFQVRVSLRRERHELNLRPNLRAFWDRTVMVDK